MEEATYGLMIRERAYIAQILCGVCEKQTQFKVATLDPAVVPENPEDVHCISTSLSQVRALGVRTSIAVTSSDTWSLAYFP